MRGTHSRSRTRAWGRRWSGSFRGKVLRPGQQQTEQALGITGQGALGSGEAHGALRLLGDGVCRGPGRADALMPSGRKQASVLGHAPKGG